MKIYIVSGDTGEYSDHREWIVCAYTRREDAEGRMRLLESLAAYVEVPYDGKRMFAIDDEEDTAWRQNSRRRQIAEDRVRTHPDGDPDAHIDYSGIRWTVQEIELKDQL